MVMKTHWHGDLITVVAVGQTDGEMVFRVLIFMTEVVPHFDRSVWFAKNKSRPYVRLEKCMNFDRGPERDIVGFQVDQALFLDNRLDLTLVDKNATKPRTDDQFGGIFDPSLLSVHCSNNASGQDFAIRYRTQLPLMPSINAIILNNVW